MKDGIHPEYGESRIICALSTGPDETGAPVAVVPAETSGRAVASLSCTWVTTSTASINETPRRGRLARPARVMGLIRGVKNEKAR